MSEAEGGKLRLDKWLWYARFFKTRALASQLCQAGRVRVNSSLIAKPHYHLRPDDVLTFPQARAVRVIKVLALGNRRGPASEAQQLYQDLAPPSPPAESLASEAELPVAARDPGTGRPTKRDRRRIDQWRQPP